MGTDVNQLKADAANENVFQEQAELTMAGNWQLFVKVLPPKVHNYSEIHTKWIVQSELNDFNDF